MNPAIQAVRTALNEPLKSERVCREVVLAVLRSVREPSDGMTLAAENLDVFPAFSSTPSEVAADEAKWRAMIDALIAELTL